MDKSQEKNKMRIQRTLLIKKTKKDFIKAGLNLEMWRR